MQFRQNLKADDPNRWLKNFNQIIFPEKKLFTDRCTFLTKSIKIVHIKIIKFYILPKRMVKFVWWTLNWLLELCDLSIIIVNTIIITINKNLFVCYNKNTSPITKIKRWFHFEEAAFTRVMDRTTTHIQLMVEFEPGPYSLFSKNTNLGWILEDNFS